MEVHWNKLWRSIKQHKRMAGVVSFILSVMVVVRLYGDAKDSKELAAIFIQGIAFLCSDIVGYACVILLLAGVAYVFQELWLPQLGRWWSYLRGVPYCQYNRAAMKNVMERMLVNQRYYGYSQIDDLEAHGLDQVIFDYLLDMGYATAKRETMICIPPGVIEEIKLLLTDKGRDWGMRKYGIVKGTKKGEVNVEPTNAGSGRDSGEG